MSVEYTIICDKCSRLIDASSLSAAAARLSVREMGGRVNLRGGRDLCNECARELPPEPPGSLAAAMSQAAGVFGNHERWHVRRGEHNPECWYCVAAS